jgi:AbrB family looped-hinge helix DNA binding protein
VNAKLSSKGQIVIPKEIRKHLGLKPGDQVKLEILEGRRAVIEPSAPPPKEVFFRAGGRILEEALEEAQKADEAKIRELLKSLGVSD